MGGPRARRDVRRRHRERARAPRQRGHRPAAGLTPAPRRLLLDTNVLVDLERRLLTPTDVSGPDDDVAVPAIVLAEYRTGVERARTPEQRRRRERVLDALLLAVTVLDFTETTAEHYATLAAHTLATGKKRGQNDLQIAAHAAETQRLVVTRDFSAKFDDLPGVRPA
ncbi:type II toxin-antitoxin system VapC family toxin [Georgenia alba]|uniref:Ribonuclease VapC n=1 Tax=Georgenia alba TaxID=2233858 RepID=A0ABW2Q429_9MICO